jgi:predicted nucleic-acid-binding Zn-ribbon protein
MTVMAETMRPETAAVESTKQCARCGGMNLVPGRLEHGMNFFISDETHHSLCKIPLKANLCPDCGYTEFWVIEPSLVLPCEEDEPFVQEEDF